VRLPATSSYWRLATGALPCRLRLATNNPNAVYLRTFDEAIALGARLRQGARAAVIGGGFIGLELAAAARQQGCPVTVIKFKLRILMRAVPKYSLMQSDVNSGCLRLLPF
jgi:3-phenylpropionate/trans-cinnamate dioxygenase ferredoxin reductase subunit